MAEKNSLSAQIEAARRWFAQAPGGAEGDAYVATVDEPQGFSFAARADAVVVQPRVAVPWSWKMKPADGRAAVPRAEKEKVSYDRGAGVTEWYVNGEGGPVSALFGTVLWPSPVEAFDGFASAMDTIGEFLAVAPIN